MTIEASIDTRLNAVTALTDLVGTRIYRHQRPRRSAIPSVVYQRITTERVNHAGGETATRNSRFQVDSWGADQATARSVADAVATALSGWSDAAGTPSISMSHLVNDVDGQDAPAHGTDSPVFRVTQDYELWYS